MLAGIHRFGNTTRRTLSVCAVGLLLTNVTTSARAAITLDLTPVDTSAVLPGYVSYDLDVTSETDWTAAVGLLELTSGSIYQHAQGSNIGPTNAAVVAMMPGLAFDTHVIGHIAGGAGDLDGAGYAFDESRLDTSWYNISSDDIGTTTIGRVTLTDDAAGAMSILLASAKSYARYDITIEPGVLPALTEIIEVVEEKPKPWTQPELPILPPREDWTYLLGTDFVSEYGEFNPYHYDFNAPLLYISPNDRLGRPEYVYPLPGSRLDTPTLDPRRLKHTSELNMFKTTLTASATSSLLNTLPEPGTLVLMGAGVLALMKNRRR